MPERLARALDVRTDDIERWRILAQKSRHPRQSGLAFVYSAEVVVPAERKAIERTRPGTAGAASASKLYDEPPFEMPAPGSEPLPERPVIVGSGPAGTLAAYFLAEQGYRPLVIERGRMVRERIHDMRAFEAGGPHNPESNYLFGEGGAGTFSDGKLTCRGSGPDVRRILELLAECKGRPSILYDHRPHLGSNRLPAVVKALRQRIEAAGGEFRFQCRVEDFDLLDGRGCAGWPLRPAMCRPRSWCWPSATAPAIRTKCCTPGACRWCKSRFRSACGSSSRKQGQPRAVRRRRGWKIGWARPITAWWPTATRTSSPFACAPADR